ncbi:MAG TPA: outer membrane lipoprotein carrier protein LolA [candidate division Zixibacteria bacterium]|jgi:chaperone LolA|nr:outer membrane lipoprotein carrier protein LolA [candidate division Zixibacteria bacterium]
MRNAALAAACFLLAASFGAAQEPAEVMAKVREAYRDVADFRADFVQITCDAASGTCTKFEGRLEAKRPNLLRMEVKKPENQLIICDGQSLWVHLVKDKQAVRVPLDRTSNFLVWLSPLNKLISAKVRNGCLANGDYQIWLDLPEMNDLFKEVKILVNRQSYIITGLDVTDVNDNTAEYRFIGTKLNAKPKDDRFKFTVPKGVSLINTE